MSPPPSAAAAVAACTRLIEAAPRVVESGRLGGDSLADAYIERGILYMEMKDFDRSLDDFNLAIQAQSDSYIAWTDRGKAHAMRGDLDLAVADFQPRRPWATPLEARRTSNAANRWRRTLRTATPGMASPQ